MYGILSQLSKMMGRPAMKRVLEIIKKHPDMRPVRNLKDPNVSDKSRLGIAKFMAEGSDRYLDPHPGTFMNYVRGKVGNDPTRFRRISDYFRAKPEARKEMDDWYMEMGSDGWWSRGFLDDMIEEAEMTPMTLEDLAAAELSRVGRRPYSTSAVNRYLTKEFND